MAAAQGDVLQRVDSMPVEEVLMPELHDFRPSIHQGVREDKRIKAAGTQRRGVDDGIDPGKTQCVT